MSFLICINRYIELDKMRRKRNVLQMKEQKQPQEETYRKQR